MKLVKYCWVISLLLASALTNAEEAIKVVGLFKNAAMVDYAGKQKFYRAGQSISPTIKLVSATPRSAIFLIDGKKVELGLEAASSFSGSYQKPSAGAQEKAAVAKIVRSNGGMYMTPGSINGIAVRFLVDTGASQVAMNERVAKLVGLGYLLDGERVRVSTAAGNVPAWRAMLKKVRVGGIELTNVDALVVQGDGPGEVLLGMSFLNRVKMDYDGALLRLSKKY